jgi:hypothetical protein
MAKVCVQCDKKLGLFKKAIDGIYCSYECRDAGRQDIVDNERRSGEMKIQAAREEAEAAERARETAEREAAAAAVKSTCPKCGRDWSLSPGAADGLDRGHCTFCGLTAEFSGIEECPTCKGISLLVEASGARCPRCKFRRG